MGSMKDMLGDDLFTYPLRPGWREPITSKAAAEDMASSADTIRAEVLGSLREKPKTVHETASALQRSIPAVQPRFSELRALGKIVATGEQRINTASGKRAHVWKAL